MSIERNSPPLEEEFDRFQTLVAFSMPFDFWNFYQESNGAEILTDEKYIRLFSLSEMTSYNSELETNKYAPDYFLIGSNGSGEGYAISRKNAKIYMLPFVGLANEEAIYVCNSIQELIQNE